MQLIKWDNMFDVAQKLALPRIYNLLTDLKAENDVGPYNTWIADPMVKIIAALEASLKRYPPVKMGTPDPYTPPT